MDNIYCNCNEISGPFHIIGDCHGCADELVELLENIGYVVGSGGEIFAPKDSRLSEYKLVFVGDYCDRGPKSAQVLHILMKAWQDGPAFFPQLTSLKGQSLNFSETEELKGAYRFALGSDKEKCLSESVNWQEVEEALRQGLCGENGLTMLQAAACEGVYLKRWLKVNKLSSLRRIPVLAVKGNHDLKLEKVIDGRNVQSFADRAATVLGLRAAWQGYYQFAKGQFRGLFPFSLAELRTFLADLPCYITLEGGNLLVSHAGLCENLQGKNNKQAAHFCLFGDTNGKLNEEGMPIRRHWENEYQGQTQVVYGHTPVELPAVCGRTVNIDTGCVFGGSLSAYSYPDGQIFSTPCQKAYFCRQLAEQYNFCF
ncbi:MAG: metallophosphoesterase [Candidatus Bruticola sp.]